MTLILLTLAKIRLWSRFHSHYAETSYKLTENNTMRISLFILSLLLFISCEEYNDHLTEMVGIYDGKLVGDNQFFDVVISLDRGDDLRIEAPFDGEIIDLAIVDVDCVDCDVKELSIDDQFLDQDVSIVGSGFYSFGSIQLDYTMYIFGDTYDFSLVAER